MFEDKVPPETTMNDPEQERRIRAAQKHLADAAKSLYLAHRELETALRLNSLSTALVERRIQEFLSNG